MGGRQMAFERCSALLRRGVVSGSDTTELFDAFAGATGCVGLWFSVEGVGSGAEQIVRSIDPAWIDAYTPHAGVDPSPGIAAAMGPFAVFSSARHTPAYLWKTELGGAFKRAGWADAAVMHVGGGCNGAIAAYRPRGLKPFSSAALARMSALLPLFELTFAPISSRRALEAPSVERERAALDRIDTYALLGAKDGEIAFSAGALRLFARLFDGFNARGERRVERALRLAHERFTQRRGTRVIHLRRDLVAELSLLPRPGEEGELLVTFSLRKTEEDTSLRPHDELLSPSQRFIARRVASGATLPTVGRELGISSDTVKVHLREVYRRLGVESRAELAALYAG